MSLTSLLDSRLPMNRKERFFTGTVFPMIVAGDGFGGLQKFLDLAEVPPRRDRCGPGVDQRAVLH